MDPLGPVLEAVASRANDRAPVVVGIAGAVAVGKSTIAMRLTELLATRGLTIRVISTDDFLLPNAELAERDLIMRKGFPETYDAEAIARVVGRLKGGHSAETSVYSHDIYDIVADATQTIEPADVIVIEGVIALQSLVLPHLDVAVYVDADDDVVRGWFVERFVRLTDAARNDASSFYHRFGGLDPEQLRRLAEGTWDGINGLNLKEHIAPSKKNAHLVVEKAPDHTIVQVRGVRG